MREIHNTRAEELRKKCRKRYDDEKSSAYFELILN